MIVTRSFALLATISLLQPCTPRAKRIASTRRMTGEAEWKTRKKRIDPKLDGAGWPRPHGKSRPASFRTEEEETDHGPAHYALWLGEEMAGVVEAKKLTVGPQNVLTQAQRYSRGARRTSKTYPDGFRVPFLYSTNGEVFWFHDVRDPMNRSRRVAGFHTPAAFEEMLGHDFDGACARLLARPHDHPWLRPYQAAANAAVEKAISERKRSLLVAMATGTGKTFTLVNQVYRLMKAGVVRRVLFLVDRRALAAQAVRAFAAFEAEPGKKFDQIYGPPHGGVANQPALNGAKVRALPLPLPPVEEQAAIVQRVRGLLSVIDELEARVVTATKVTERLPQAILAKAFSGQLVPTEAELARAEGREFEPASALLARLTLDEAPAPRPRRGRRKTKAKAST
ncbi:MAG: DEAD/DEAH box helicase family protein [Sandaracinaceae bacterium]|nr:DEAD/DEAH box helicase family protein [Sandaracinaceae bacterium]